MRLLPFCWLLMCLNFLLTPAGAQERAERIRIVTTNAILADIAREVGGDHVLADTLVPPGADLHAFVPSPAQIKALQAADLVIINGLGLEGWIEKAIQNSGYTGPVIEASRGVKAISGHDEHEHGELDPHAWLDLANGILYANNIQDALQQIDSAHSDDYAAWGELYVAQLRVLDSWVKRQVSRIPAERRVLIMDHDAFRYFAAAYGFETLALRGVSKLNEPSAQEAAGVVQLIKRQAIPAVFVESAENQKLLEQLAREANVAVGGRIYVDGFAEKGNQSYVALFKSNVRTIVRALEMKPQ